MKWVNYILLLLSLTIVPACEKLLFSDVGDPAISLYDQNHFSRINIKGVFNVELQSDSLYSVKVESFDALIDSVIVRFESDTLVLEDHNSFSWYPDYPRPTIVVSFPRLDNQIYMEFPAYVYSTDSLSIPRLTVTALGKSGEFDLLLNTDIFHFSTGTDNYGTYTFRGRAGSVNFMPRGSSVLDAAGLKTGNAYVYNNSIADCSINVSNSLKVKLDTYGNIYYYGDPENITITEESGKGKLIKGEK